MEKPVATELLKKLRAGTLTEQERAILERWYLELAKNERPDLQADELEKELDLVWNSLPVHAPKRLVPLRPLLRWSAVAASLLLVGTLGFYLLRNQGTGLVREPAVARGDALPGDSKARLTLANGQEIVLDQAGTGMVAQEGQTTIIKTKQGEIEYQYALSPTGSREHDHPAYNTIKTPKAGQFQVKLPDGTQVWLNAASSIRFPARFPTSERVVEIAGEVYFEVAKVTANKVRVPFKVKAGNQVVEVLGTHFNVNSYADERSIKTTLLEGSIRLTAGGNQSVLLRPGQQAKIGLRENQTGKAGPSFEVKPVDTQSVVAWKDGYFRFDNVGLPELMRQLSRWYDMDVVYEGPVREYEFVGQIERNTRLSKVLQILELGDVHFRIEGKKIIVTEQ